MIDTFKFWCYKVLPLVYDDSLSYYEVLCKCVKYINALIDEDRGIIEDIEALKAQIEIIQQWIDDFDTEVAERIIREALAKITSVLFTSTIIEDDATAPLNNAFNNGVREVLVDKDITIYGLVTPPSGTTFTGMGGTIYEAAPASGETDNARIFGQGSEELITLTDNQAIGIVRYFTVLSTAGIEIGKRYKLVGTVNLFDREAVSASEWLGTGTGNATVVHGQCEFIVTNVDNELNRVYMDRPTPYYIGANARVYKANDLENITFQNVHIVGTGRLIHIKYCNNISIRNCVLDSTPAVSGVEDDAYPIFLSDAYECEIDDCTIINDYDIPAQTNRYNTVRVQNAGECKIANNKISGGFQAIDISYGGSTPPTIDYTPRIAYNNIINGNTISGAVSDSITTHPGVIYTIISNNRLHGDVALRCKGHLVTGNMIRGNISFGTRPDGTTVSNNVIYNQTSFQFLYNPMASTPIDRLVISNNTLFDVNRIFSGTMNSTEDDGGPFCTLALYFTGNIVTAAGNYIYLTDITSLDGNHHDPAHPEQTPTLSAPFYRMFIKDNTFTANTVTLFYGAADQESPTFKRMAKGVKCPLVVLANNTFNTAASGAQSNVSFNNYNGNITTARVNANFATFNDSLATATAAQIGAALPAHPVTGDTFYNTTANQFAIYNGSAWKTIDAT